MTPRDPSSKLWPSGLLFALSACSAPSAPPVPVPFSAGAQATQSLAPRASASSPAAPASSASAPPATEDDAPVDLMAGAIDKKVTNAPCDFARPYRGKVGESALSVTLRKNGDEVTGFLRYDAGNGELELTGTLASGQLTLKELVAGKQVGTLTARCDTATGTLTGAWSKDQTVKPLTLRPLPAGGTAIAQQGRQLGLGEESRCTFNILSPVVFGLGDASRTGRINSALSLDLQGVDDKKIERDVSACAKGVSIKALGWYAIEANEKGLLSVVMDGYLDVAPSVHGDFNAASRSVSIDVPSGKVLSLSDIVKSPKALRPVVKTCMEMTSDAIGSGDAWWWEREIQGVPSDRNGDEAAEGSKSFDPRSLHDPAFLVLPDGLAVLIPPQPTVSSQLSGQGPVIQWGALVRAGVLNDKSVVSRLWKGTAALPSEAPACTRYFKPGWAMPAAPK